MSAYTTNRMLFKEEDTHVRLDKIFTHLTVDFDDWDEKTNQQKSDAWKGVWTVTVGFLNLFW